MVESIGKRIASFRQKHGWTQQSLADRLAMSRVAISHIEMDLTIPSERTITLMAGLFKLTPHELVEGTSYPRAKAERLPDLTTTHTEIELNLALLKNDLEWLARLDDLQRDNWKHEIFEKWYPLVDEWRHRYSNEPESRLLLQMREILQQINERTRIHIA